MKIKQKFSKEKQNSQNNQNNNSYKNQILLTDTGTDNLSTDNRYSKNTISS